MAPVHTESFVKAVPVFEIVLSALVDIRSTNEFTFGGPVLIVVDQGNMSI